MLSDPVALHGECGASGFQAELRFPGRKTSSIGAVAAMLGMPIRIIGELVKGFAKQRRITKRACAYTKTPYQHCEVRMWSLTISGTILGLHAGWEQLDIVLGGESLGAFVKAILDGRINPRVLTKRAKESMQDVFRTNWVEIFDA